MAASNIKIVLLGKTGAGKSSASNTIFGEDVFQINHSPNPGTSKCEKKNRSVNGRSISLIDTPGFFDPDKSEKELRPEIVTCITECAPGPHVFLILLKVEKFTTHENQVIDEIRQSFSEEAFKYAAVVFTHGDQLPEGMEIEEFVSESKGLNDLVEKCGGRCHVIDNKYWKNKQQDEYRSNQFQVAELLNTIDKIIEANKGGCYTNKMLQEVERMITKHGKINVSNILKTLAGISTGVLLGALLGVPAMVILIVEVLLTTPIANLVVVEAAVGAAGITAGIAAGVAAAAGAVAGGYIGYREADQADSVREAAENTAKVAYVKAQQLFKKMQINQKATAK